MATERIVSGIKPTSNLFDHEYDLKLSNWIRLQHESECFFFVADLHSLVARDAKPELIEKIEKNSSKLDGIFKFSREESKKTGEG